MAEHSVGRVLAAGFHARRFDRGALHGGAEHDPRIGALEQRSDALCGLEWDVVAGDGREGSREAAEAFAHALANAGLTEDAEGRPETFQELLPNLVDAVVLPFTAESCWDSRRLSRIFSRSGRVCFPG